MSWWGKIVGGALGFAMGGPLGLVLGAAFGHSFDKGLKSSMSHTEQSQAVFFSTVFTLMGHIAKADGVISQHEINIAREVFRQMRLNEQQQQAAIKLFNIGKRDDFNIEKLLQQASEYITHPHLKTTMMQMLLYSAYGDGKLHRAEKAIIKKIGEALNIAQHTMDAVEQAVRHSMGLGENTIAEAYQVLDLHPQATKNEVKRKYRVLMKENHPDKLTSRGLPEEMIEIANKKTAEIARAYRQIMDSR